MQELTTLPDYQRLDGAVPVLYPPEMEDRARELCSLLETGVRELSAILEVEPPELQALLVAEEDWKEAPRESSKPYPPGLPYFTHSTAPPALVMPERLSPAFRPRTEALFPLTVWHELAHAFLLQAEVVRTPVWLREFVPQAATVAVARRTKLPLDEHLSQVNRPNFAVREFGGRAGAEEQMAFQNLLLLLGDAALEEFGDGFLGGLARALWDEEDVVDEERAEELLADALGTGGREWLLSRPEF
ncbi:MAG TPA: hypothetical protein VFE21_02180 [Rubrobacteraceae bacterium]|nr:hypothetical protein [Rubrobacteraceae bacterium]